MAVRTAKASKTENVAWVVDVPGRGSTSPRRSSTRTASTCPTSSSCSAPSRSTEMSLATPALAHDGVFLRAAGRLYRIGN